MLLGSDTLGRLAVGQLPDNDGLAGGVTLAVAATLIAGIASVETAPVRMVGGSAFSRSRKHAFAQGAVLTLDTWIDAGGVTAEQFTPSGRNLRVVPADHATLMVIRGWRDDWSQEDKNMVLFDLLDSAPPGKVILRYVDEEAA